MERIRLNPLNDYLFMKYMGEKGDEEQLLAFLNVVLQKTGRSGIASIEIVEHKTFSAEIIGDKASILDIRSVMPDGTKANIEVQLRNIGNIDKRSLFYWSREYVKGIEAGQDYLNLPCVIAINIVDFEAIPLNEVHTSFHLWEDEQKECLLTDALEIHFIDMVKFRQLREKDIMNNPLHRWLTFFDKHTNEHTLKEVIKMDTAIEKAQKKIRFVAQDKEMLREYQMREMALSDFTSGINNARREGIAIGERQGIAIGERQGIAIGKQQGIAIGERRGEQRGIDIGEQQGNLKRSVIVVVNLRSAGFPVEKIADYTQLPVEDVIKILKEHGLA